jgi:hypothetical protein
MDLEGETLHSRVLVHIMMRLDVEGVANTSGFLKALLSSSTANLLRRRAVPRWHPWPSAPSPTYSDGGFRRCPPFFPASTAVGSSTPSPPSLGD